MKPKDTWRNPNKKPIRETLQALSDALKKLEMKPYIRKTEWNPTDTLNDTTQIATQGEKLKQSVNDIQNETLKRPQMKT